MTPSMLGLDPSNLPIKSFQNRLPKGGDSEPGARAGFG
ncbi:MAG: hypothetical protein ACI814_002533 [Mariniblastus sp.]|jgi:hypothetical protein